MPQMERRAAATPLAALLAETTAILERIIFSLARGVKKVTEQFLL